MNRWTDRHVGNGRVTDGGGSVSGRAPAAPPTPHRPACPGLGILGHRPHARTRRPGSHRLPSATSTAVSAQLGDARRTRPVARPLPPPRPAAVSTLPADTLPRHTPHPSPAGHAPSLRTRLPGDSHTGRVPLRPARFPRRSELRAEPVAGLPPSSRPSVVHRRAWALGTSWLS